MQYKDIYPDEFLNKFGKYKTAVGNIELGESNQIDVEAIAKACGIKIQYVEHEHECKCYNDEENCITVYKFDPQTRKRQDIAHKLGHLLLKHESPDSLFSKLTLNS